MSAATVVELDWKQKKKESWNATWHYNLRYGESDSIPAISNLWVLPWIITHHWMFAGEFLVRTMSKIIFRRVLFYLWVQLNGVCIHSSMPKCSVNFKWKIMTTSFWCLLRQKIIMTERRRSINAETRTWDVERMDKTTTVCATNELFSMKNDTRIFLLNFLKTSLFLNGPYHAASISTHQRHYTASILNEK